MNALINIAADIRREHQAAQACAGQAVEHAKRAGELLVEAKAAVPHGEWLPWLTTNVAFSERTAQGYMRIARELPKLEGEKAQRVADMPLRDALQALAEPDDKWKFKAQPTLQSMSVDWYTPQRYIEAARAVLGEIDLDPASCADANRVVQARRFYTKEDDGLAQPWGGRVWCNPPYSGEAGKFASKLYAEYVAGNVRAGILLVNSQTTPNQWFAPLWDSLLCFTNHRIAFEPGAGQAESHPTYGAIFAYYGPDPARFAEVFSELGTVVRRWAGEVRA